MRLLSTLILLIAVTSRSPLTAAKSRAFDDQLASINSAMNDGNFFKASALVSGLRRDVEEASGYRLPAVKSREAMFAGRDPLFSIQAHLDDVRISASKKEWDIALYNLEASQAALITKDMQIPAETRYRRDVAEAEKQESFGFYHRVAQSALNAGHPAEAVQWIGREIDSLPKTVPGPAAAMKYRAYSLMGSAWLAMGDTAKASKALLDSANDPAHPPFPESGPSLLLARQLLERGQGDVVISFLDRIGKIGWQGGEIRLATWKAEIRAGSKPDFGPQGTR